MNSLQRHNILNELIANTKTLVRSGYYQPQKNKSPLPKFSDLLSNQFSILGEIKPGSPTEGRIFDTVELKSKIKSIASEADGISVLTEPNYFHGSLSTLNDVSSFNKPVLMKDFIIDTIQIDSALSSAILLIERILDPLQRDMLIQYAHSKDLEVILEVDNESDFHTCIETSADILAINNRNLDTMKLDVKKAEKIVEEFEPDRFILGLSGYTHPQDVANAYQKGLRGVLIGTILSKSSNSAKLLKQFRSEVEVNS